MPLELLDQIEVSLTVAAVILCIVSLPAAIGGRLSHPRLFATFWIVAALLLLWWVPRFQILLADSRHQITNWAEAENGYRTTWAQILGGGVLLFGAYAAWRNAQAAHRNAKANEQGQITERFTRAIDQLGKLNEKDGTSHVVIRLGGIHSLAQIAEEAPETYHRQVVEVLTAYLRETAPSAGDPQKALLDYFRNTKDVTEQSSGPEPKPVSARADIQAALSALARRKVHKELEPERLNLRRTYLEGADLRFGKFEKANFEGANLRGARIWSTELHQSWFKDADLRHSEFEGVAASQGRFENADLRNARLAQVNLEQAFLRGAKLENAELLGCNLVRADLTGATGLRRSQLLFCEFDSTTILTDGQPGRSKREVCETIVHIPGLLDD